MDKKTLTLMRLQEVLSYDRETGKFTWKVSRRCVQKGDPAGTINNKGYVAIKIDGRLYLAHRLAWMYETGEMPDFEVDHRDRIRIHNWFGNLRPATTQQNRCNTTLRVSNRAGLKGVYFRSDRNKWQAQIGFNGRVKNLGQYSTPDEAHEVYCLWADMLHGEFSSNGVNK